MSEKEKSGHIALWLALSLLFGAAARLLEALADLLRLFI
jgi:hypothetical protein